MNSTNRKVDLLFSHNYSISGDDWSNQRGRHRHQHQPIVEAVASIIRSSKWYPDAEKCCISVWLYNSCRGRLLSTDPGHRWQRDSISLRSRVILPGREGAPELPLYLLIRFMCICCGRWDQHSDNCLAMQIQPNNLTMAGGSDVALLMSPQPSTSSVIIRRPRLRVVHYRGGLLMRCWRRRRNQLIFS